MKTLRTLLTALTLLLAPALRADTLTVTSNADSGAGTLRQAVLDAAASGDTIVFAASLSGATIVLGSEIALAKSLAIDASSLPAGVTISGNNASRIFSVAGSQVALQSLTLTGGNGAAANFNHDGGAILNNGGTLMLTRCTLSGNSASGGGAIENFDNSTLTLTHCTLSAIPPASAARLTTTPAR